MVLLGLMWKFGLPPVRKMLKDRADKISGDLERADEARAEAERELEEYRRQLAKARNEGSQIIEQILFQKLSRIDRRLTNASTLS